ncbi:MAG: hypothetical protein K6G42_02755, partial [Lachnospiraceae bacterium]|nr:hypothetical protein [Lachnospiraceae bacterium]
QIPKIYGEETIEYFRKIASTAHTIFDKVIKEYREKEDYRKLFPFSKELEELMLLPMQYEGYLAIARMDIFYNEDTGDFKFCEVNADGTASMLRDAEMRRALIHNPAHQEVIRHYDFEVFELFDTWVKAFMDLYNTYPKKRQKPNVALVDFLEYSTICDFWEFAQRFQEAGFNCEICDIRSLEYRDGALYSATGNRIDAVYRRVVTADLMAHYEEASALLNCVRDDNVFMAGAFCTQAIHSKNLFRVLHLDRTKSFLTEEEREFVEKHIPKTFVYSTGSIDPEEIRKNKDHYIIKPMDAYASRGIYAAGREYTQEDWDRVTVELLDKGYVCQEFCEQYVLDNIDYAWGDGEWHPFLNMTGLYVYNGEFAGIHMRMAEGDGIIVAFENERTAPLYVVKGRKED